MVDLILVDCDPDSRAVRDGHVAILRMERFIEKELELPVVLDEIFDKRTDGWRMSGHDVDVGGYGVAVRDHRDIVDGCQRADVA